MSASKFHISLNVHDLKKAAGFLELLLGTKPTQSHSNYVKFELADPAVVLSLIPTCVPGGNGINHLGIRLPNRAALDSLQERLRQVGVSQEIEESVACCYSKQSKAWVHDRSGNLWEFYVLEESAECEPKHVGEPADLEANPRPESLVQTSWGHRLGAPIPESIAAENGSLDELVFEGTFNARLANGQAEHLLSEAARALRPGGNLLVHCLTADQPLSATPKLPGPASKVEHVLTHQELIEAITNAGFVGIELVTFGETYSFTHGGAELRETKLEATRGHGAGPRNHIAVYRGPFSEVCDDAGQVFRRGEPTRIDEETCCRLRNSSSAGQFSFSRATGDDALRSASRLTPDDVHVLTSERQ